MSMATLEKAIWKEFKNVTGLKKTKFGDLQEWSIGEIEKHDGEVVVYLPGMGVWAAFKKVK